MNAVSLKYFNEFFFCFNDLFFKIVKVLEKLMNNFFDLIIMVSLILEYLYIYVKKIRVKTRYYFNVTVFETMKSFH
jgi:hypothetical protein